MFEYENGKKVKSALDDDVFEIKAESIPFDEGSSSDELIKALDKAVKENIFACDNSKEDNDQ